MKRSRWPGRNQSRPRIVTALAATGAIALSMVIAVGPAASGSIAAAHGLVAPRATATLGHLGNSGQPKSGHRFVRLDGSPGAPLASPETNTVYVPIQCLTSSCTKHVVDVIDAATCNSKVISGCRVVARAEVGPGPLAATIDPRTDTVYVVNGNNTVSLLNGSRCNARVTSGCDRPLATVKTGKSPVAAAVNPATRTLYVANIGGRSVSVINIAACNARTTRGCGQPRRTVKVTPSPDWIATNVATNTVYTANAGNKTPQVGHTVSVINGATCNGHTGRGCGRITATVKVGVAPFALAVDKASNTVYVANFDNGFNAGSVSVIDGARCNAHDTAGCARRPPEVPAGSGASFVAVDSAVHTVFAVNKGDNTLSAIDTRTCNGRVTSDCSKRPPNQQATPVHEPGFNPFPNGIALIPRTGTAYVVNAGGPSILSVTSIRRCNAANTSGCRAEAPTVPEGASLLSADPTTDTIYAGNLNRAKIDVINGATCRSRRLVGCVPVARIPVPAPGANVGAIDKATHTLYAADPPSKKVFMINTATCNASDTSGCATAPSTVKIGPFPNAPVINPVSKTMYVSYGVNANNMPNSHKVAVVNAAACNATDTSGCGKPPGVVKVGTGTVVLTVSPATDTIYGPASGATGHFRDTVAVINGATCNGTNHSGCGRLAATAKVGSVPFGAAVNDRTHSLYVANNADGDSPGTVSVINTTSCNGTTIIGCRGSFPTAPTGPAPLVIAADARAGTLYVTDSASASVTILRTKRCNAANTSGCAKSSREQAVGSAPLFGLAVNPVTDTVYVANSYLRGTMSIFSTIRR